MNDMLKMIILFLKRYKYTIVVFIYFQIIVYFQIRTAWHRGPYLFYLLNASSLLLILHLISKSKLIIRIALIVIFSLLIAFEAYYAFFFNCSISLGIISSIMVTNITEVTDVMRGRILPSIIIFALSIFVIFKTVNELKIKTIPAKWSVLLLSAYMFVCFPLYVFRKIKKDADFDLNYTGSAIRTCQMIITERFPLIYGQISSVLVSIQEMQQVKKNLLRNRILLEGVSWKDEEWLPEKIYFVLGESQYREHLSLYGYDVKTTPFLDSLYQSSSKMTIYNAISPGCTTLDVTRLLFTYATPSNLNPFFTHKNIIELANDAGYQTVWLSNQTTFDQWGGIITFISSLSNDTYFTGYEDITKNIDDLSLIPKLREKYIKNMKQFFVVHLQGSHGSYSTKYDKIDEIAIKGNNTKNQYDRSIHHTDRVLKEIYHVMKNDSSSILFYISDHGENIEMGGHGYLIGDLSQFEVPMFIINQSEIDVNAIVDKYFLHKKNRINTLSSINILTEWMGYSYADEIISEVREQSNYIYHADGRTYKYDELE